MPKRLLLIIAISTSILASAQITRRGFFVRCASLVGLGLMKPSAEASLDLETFGQQAKRSWIKSGWASETEAEVARHKLQDAVWLQIASIANGASLERAEFTASTPVEILVGNHRFRARPTFYVRLSPDFVDRDQRRVVAVERLDR